MSNFILGTLMVIAGFICLFVTGSAGGLVAVVLALAVFYGWAVSSGRRSR
jgi:hypothetical protein